MKKITVDNLIEFRRKKSDSTKFTVLHKSQKEKIKVPGETGGHYWVCCISAANSVFKNDDKKYLNIKINELRKRIEETEHEVSKNRWQQSINMITNLHEFDFESLKPSSDITFIKKPSDRSILKINELSIEAEPNHVFSFKNADFEEIGAVWFIAKKDGFSKSELAMFCDITYRYLTINFSEKFKINPRFCIAVDLFNGQEVNYKQFIDGEINYLLDIAIEDVKAALTKLNYR